MYPRRYLTRRLGKFPESELKEVNVSILKAVLSIPDCIVKLKKDGDKTLVLADLYFYFGLIEDLLGSKFNPLKHRVKRLGNWWYDLKELEERLTGLYELTANYLRGEEFDSVRAIKISQECQVFVNQLLKVQGLTLRKLFDIGKEIPIADKELKEIKSTKPKFGKRGRPNRKTLEEKLGIELGTEIKMNYPKKRKNRFLTTRGKRYTKRYLRIRARKAWKRRLEREATENRKDKEENSESSTSSYISERI